ncbi:MAG: prepilin-type N-terminal cleavage/methylation domain-containing protein [Candidatus Omnitrophica bacterium]|jgi:Tfp pilus assembly protein PilV|nr:prepilin-type N-terminal cleavage/methylation domain-containing protein [Candidatus Omnitrophota bacterium]
MKINPNRSVTLLELLMSLLIMSIVLAALTSINTFINHNALSSDRRSKLQNEVSYTLEHMTKEIGKARGNEVASGAGKVLAITASASAGGQVIRFLANDNDYAVPGNWAAYLYIPQGYPNSYQIRYCEKCADTDCNSCSFPASWAALPANYIIARKVKVFVPDKPMINDPSDQRLNQNYFSVRITSCWDPALASPPDGTSENPCITMETRMKMPSVSTH